MQHASTSFLLLFLRSQMNHVAELVHEKKTVRHLTSSQTCVSRKIAILCDVLPHVVVFI